MQLSDVQTALATSWVLDHRYRLKLGLLTVSGEFRRLARASFARSTSILRAILLVDDDEPFRTSVCRALRAAGCAVEAAADGKEAMKFIGAERPDILVTDIPDAEYWRESTNSVKQAYPEIPILVISWAAIDQRRSLNGRGE